MKTLALSIYTGVAGGDDDHKVTMTASFENQDEAVRFHEGVARLCREIRSQPTRLPWSGGNKLLARAQALRAL